MKRFLRIKFLSDKQNHAFYGLVLFFGMCVFVNPVVSLCFTHLIAAFVEATDRVTGKDQAEVMDYVYTVMLPTLFTILYVISKSIFI